MERKIIITIKGVKAFLEYEGQITLPELVYYLELMKTFYMQQSIQEIKQVKPGGKR